MVDGQTYQAHRLVWLYANGVLPKEDLDHINMDRADNRLLNLREATRSENKQNQQKAYSNNKSGLLGVSKGKEGWIAQITIAYKRHKFGPFETKEAAYSVYVQKKTELHPFGRLF